MKKVLCVLGTIACGFMLVFIAGIEVISMAIVLKANTEATTMRVFVFLGILGILLAVLCILAIIAMRRKFILMSDGKRGDAARAKLAAKEQAKRELKAQKEQARALEKEQVFAEKTNREQLISKQKEDEARERVLENRKEHEALRNAENEAKRKLAELVAEERAPENEKIQKVYRISGPGAEKIFGVLFFILAGLIFVAGIVIAVRNFEHIMGLPAIPYSLAVLILTIGSIAIGAGFNGIYGRAMFLSFIKSESGELYYCQLAPAFKHVSSRPRTIGQTIKVYNVGEENRETKERYQEFYNSELFDQCLAQLVSGGSVNMPVSYQFGHLPLAQYKRKGIFENIFTYRVKGCTKKIRVHKNFGLE